MCFRPRTELGTGNCSLLGGLRNTKKGIGLLTVWGRGLGMVIFRGHVDIGVLAVCLHGLNRQRGMDIPHWMEGKRRDGAVLAWSG